MNGDDEAQHEQHCLSQGSHCHVRVRNRGPLGILPAALSECTVHMLAYSLHYVRDMKAQVMGTNRVLLYCA
jgi:hypothetical protein